jgi:hypothetical protein
LYGRECFTNGIHAGVAGGVADLDMYAETFDRWEQFESGKAEPVIDADF